MWVNDPLAVCLNLCLLVSLGLSLSLSLGLLVIGINLPLPHVTQCCQASCEAAPGSQEVLQHNPCRCCTHTVHAYVLLHHTFSFEA